MHKDSFNLQSHKTKHLVQHLRRLLGHRCHSALLVHEGNLDINDNCRSWVKPAVGLGGFGWPLEQRPLEFLGRHLANGPFYIRQPPPHPSNLIYHWIGVRENLQFTINYREFLEISPLKPP